MVEQPQSSNPFGSQVFMMNGTAPISIATRSKYYLELRQAAGKEIIDALTPPPPSFGPLHIEGPSSDPVVRPPSKVVLHKSSYNTNAHATQNYNIFEDLAQAPSTVSTVEMLQSYLS